MACVGTGCPDVNTWRQEDFNRWAVYIVCLAAAHFFLRSWSCYSKGLRSLKQAIFWRISAFWNGTDLFEDEIGDSADSKEENLKEPVALGRGAGESVGNQKKGRRAGVSIDKPSGKSRKLPTRLDPNRTEELLAQLVESLYNEEPLYDELPAEDVSISKVQDVLKVCHRGRRSDDPSEAQYEYKTGKAGAHPKQEQDEQDCRGGYSYCQHGCHKACSQSDAN